MNPIAEFLVANENFFEPIIEWGGMLLFLAIVLSPFLIIRHRIFRPTRWWHIVGAYASSFATFLALWYLIDKTNQWIAHNVFISLDLSSAYTDALVYGNLWTAAFYPFLVFYSARLLYGSFTKKVFWITFGAALSLFAVVVMMGGYTLVSLLGRGLVGHL